MPSKKRTLSEQKESDVTLKYSSSRPDDKADEKVNEKEKSPEEIDKLQTYQEYLTLKSKTLGDTKKHITLMTEREASLLEPAAEASLTMDDILNQFHTIFVDESTSNEVQRINEEVENLLSAAYEEDEPDEEDEEDEEASQEKTNKIKNKLQELIKGELTKAQDALKSKQYPKVFDTLFALTMEGCVNTEDWYMDPDPSMKSSIETIFQGISDAWAQLLHKDDQIGNCEKHFVNAMMEILQKRGENNSFEWKFEKLKSSPKEILKWSVEQPKYDVKIIYQENEEYEDDSDEDNSGDGEQEGSPEDQEDGEGEQDEENAEENAEPPAKKRKL